MIRLFFRFLQPKVAYYYETQNLTNPRKPQNKKTQKNSEKQKRKHRKKKTQKNKKEKQKRTTEICSATKTMY